MIRRTESIAGTDTMPETAFSKDAPDSKHDVLSYATPHLARLKVCRATHTSMEWYALAVGRPGLTGAAKMALDGRAQRR